MLGRNRFGQVSAAALIVGLGMSSAWAQSSGANTDQKQDGAQQSVGLEEVVVTAQKRAENVQDVPIAISAIDSGYLQSRGINAIDEIGSFAPNVTIEHTPSDKTGSQIAIRGSVTINPAITWEPAVGVYLDGVYIGKAQGSIFDVADLQRIEVLRGPQGTLYGRNTLAGAINLITKKPTGELDGRVEVGYGNYNDRYAKGTLDLPKAGIFSVKLSGEIHKHDGFITTVKNPYPQAFLAGPNAVQELGNLDNRSGIVQVRAEPSSRLTFDYMFDYSLYDEKPDYAQLYHLNMNGDPRDIFDPNSVSYPYAGAYFPLNLYARTGRQSTASVDAPQLERSETWGHALTATLDLGGATLKSITAYRHLDWKDALDLDGSPLPVAATRRTTHYHALSEELQLSGDTFGDSLNYVFGLYYFQDKAETDNPQSYFAGATSFASAYGSHTQAAAAYGQLDYHVTDKLTLSGGLRYNHETKDVKRLLIIQPNTASALTLMDVAYGDLPDATYDDLSPSAMVRYQVAKSVNVYARFAKGFKSGGFNAETNVIDTPTTSCPSGLTELCNPYKPEKVYSYEVGVKSRFLDNRVQLNVDGFWDEHRDMQLSVFVGSGSAASIVRNAGAARIRGIEAEADLIPFDSLTLNASLGFLDAKYESFLDGGVNVANNRALPHAPKFTGSLGADWQVAQGDWGRFDLIADVSHVSSYFTYPYALRTSSPSDQNAYTTQSKGRTIVNLRGTVSDIPVGNTQMEVSIWVKNLTQEDRPQNFIDFGPSFGGLTVAYFPDPRTFGVNAAVSF